MKKIIKKTSELKLVDVKRQLSRAYMLVAIMSVVSILMLVLGTQVDKNFSTMLLALIIIGINLLAILSLIYSFININHRVKKSRR